MLSKVQCPYAIHRHYEELTSASLHGAAGHTHEPALQGEVSP